MNGFWWTLLGYVVGFLFPDPWTWVRLWHVRLRTVRTGRALVRALWETLHTTFSLNLLTRRLLQQVEVWYWTPVVGLTIERHRGKPPVVHLKLGKRGY